MPHPVHQPDGPDRPDRSVELSIEHTDIPGMLVVRLPVHADPRGWFKENWQREKMTALGMPDFGPVQNNISFNARRGTTRGLHAEPWDKLVSVASGRAFAAWVDLREGPTFGTGFHTELDPSMCVFVPRGVANGYQTLDDDTAYTYLVNDHWRPGVRYPALDVADPSAAIPWPIPLSEAEVSEKDRANPRLDEVVPMPPRRTLVLGAGGQVGRAFARAFPEAHAVTRGELDITDAEMLDKWPWQDYDVVLNAAAFTGVDAAETPEGRREAWAANATAPAHLARIADAHRITLVHLSSDYVYDGTREVHTEDEPLAPLGVYGQTKAAGDLAVAAARRHYLLRSSWVVGDGGNFVRTMQRLARDGVSPAVVDDQVGRLTFADEIARAAQHLIQCGAPYGTYHVTNGGGPTSWAEVAAEVFELCGRSSRDVTRVSTEQYAEGKQLAPRPAHSLLDLAKLESTGFEPADARRALAAYLRAYSSD